MSTATATGVQTWYFDDIDMDYVGSYYCMPEAAFSFCQQTAASNSECDYQSNIPSSVPGYIEGMESNINVKNAESTIVTQVQLRANVQNQVTLYKMDKCQGTKATAFFDAYTQVNLEDRGPILIPGEYAFLGKQYGSISISAGTTLIKHMPNSVETYSASDSTPLCISLSGDDFSWQIAGSDNRMISFEM